MGDRRAFLRWSVVAVATSAAFAALTGAGVVSDVVEKDASRIAIITAIFFAIMTAIMGHATWRASGIEPLRWLSHRGLRASAERELRELQEREEVGWFCSEMCLALGMLGTIIGFVLMLAGFETLDVTEATSIQGLLGELGKSMATALYTTLVGLACGSVLKIQCFNLGLEIRAKLGSPEPKADLESMDRGDKA